MPTAPNRDGDERALAATEAVYVQPGTPVVVTYTLYGPLRLDALREAVHALSAHHDVLRARLTSSARGTLLRTDPSFDPPELITDSDFQTAAAPFPPEGPVLRPSLVRKDDQTHTMFLAVHHAICDGTSVLALQELLWRIYTAIINNAPPPSPSETGGLPESVEHLLRRTYSADDLAEFHTTHVEPEPTATIPHYATGNDSGMHYHRIEITSDRVDALIHRAQSSGLSLNALLFGAITIAARRRINTTTSGELPLTFLTPVDLRPYLRPQLSRGHLVFAAVPTYAYLDVAPDTPPEHAASDIWRQLRANLVHHVPELEFLTFPNLWERAESRTPAFIVSSLLGRCEQLTLPTGTTASPPSFPVEPPTTYPAIGIGEATDGAISLDVMQPRRYFTAKQADLLTKELERSLAFG